MSSCSTAACPRETYADTSLLMAIIVRTRATDQCECLQTTTKVPAVKSSLMTMSLLIPQGAEQDAVVDEVHESVFDAFVTDVVKAVFFKYL